MTVNIKRGFNRIYIVLAVLWAFYCVILFPLQRQAEAIRQFDRDLPVCSEYGEKDPGCLGVKENWNTSMERWQFRKFYSWAWGLLLLAVIVLPAAVYGCVRGTAAIAVWVWNGFRVASS
jgi:hypothetical protein